MTASRTVWAIVAGLLLCGAAPRISHDPINGIPTITDGDTIRIGRERIRLFGIDAPEMRQSCNDAEESAKAARLGLWRGEFVLPSQWREEERAGRHGR